MLQVFNQQRTMKVGKRSEGEVREVPFQCIQIGTSEFRRKDGKGDLSVKVEGEISADALAEVFHSLVDSGTMDARTIIDRFNHGSDLRARKHVDESGLSKAEKRMKVQMFVVASGDRHLQDQMLKASRKSPKEFNQFLDIVFEGHEDEILGQDEEQDEQDAA